MNRPARLSLFAIAFLLLSIHLLSGCRGSAEQLQATATRNAMATELAQLRSTATVSRARMQITLDYAGTRVNQAHKAGEFLRSKLVEALGIDSAIIEENLRILQSQVPTAIDIRPAATPVGAFLANESPTATIPLDASLPRLENMVLASGVGPDDCAIDANPVFTPQSEKIYTVARAYNFPPTASLTSIWRSQEQEEAIPFTFTIQNAIDGNCIWTFIDQSDAAFTVGTWSVEFRLDGEALAPALSFQIVEA